MIVCQCESSVQTSWHWLPRVGKELLPPKLWSPRKEIVPVGRRRREMATILVRCSKTAASPQGGCTLLWGVRSITRGLHGQADSLLPLNITFQCQETSVERGGGERSKGNLLASTRRSCAAPKPSHRGKAFPIDTLPIALRI